MAQVRRKSLALGDLFIERMKPLCETNGFELVSTQDHATRGSQVASAHPQGYQIVPALNEFDVIAAFRAPGIVRFGLTQLYLRLRVTLRTARPRGTVLETPPGDPPPKH